MRTQYETKEDRKTERELINTYVSTRACKLPKSYGFDFLVPSESGMPEAWEVKRRKKGMKRGSFLF